MADLEYRCQNGEPCAEVVLRLVAADKSRAEGFDDVAAELRRVAERFAMVHNHGCELGEAS